MGQGSDTVLSQIAAEVLDIDMEQVVVCSFDLDTLPYDPGAYASSGTCVTGNAALLAAEDGMMFAVADQPRLTGATVQTLIEMFREKKQKKLLCRNSAVDRQIR